MKRELVVSRYKESLDWLENLDAFCGHITVYNKGLPLPKQESLQSSRHKCTIRRVLNIGREGETYLHHIIKQYDALADVTWFVQADPFYHNKDFYALLTHTEDYESRPYTGLTTHYCRKKNVPHQHCTNINNAYDSAHHQTIEYLINTSSLQITGHSQFIDAPMRSIVSRFQQKYKTSSILPYVCHLVGLPPPQGLYVPFIYSACFAVRKDTIHKHPKVTYQKLRDVLLQSNHQGGFQGYVLERMWMYIFSGRSYATQHAYWLDVFFSRISPPHRYVGLFCKKKKRLAIVRLTHKDHIQSCRKSVCLFQYDPTDFVRRLPSVTFNVHESSVVQKTRCNSLTVACKRLHQHTQYVAQNKAYKVNELWETIGAEKGPNPNHTVHCLLSTTAQRHKRKDDKQQREQRKREANEQQAMYNEHQRQLQWMWRTSCQLYFSTLVIIVQDESPHHPHAIKSHLHLFRALYHTQHTTINVHLVKKGQTSLQHMYPLGITTGIRFYQEHRARFPYTTVEWAQRIWPHVCTQHDHILLFHHNVCFTPAFHKAFHFSTTHAVVPFIHTELQTIQPYIRTKKGKATLCDRFMYLPRTVAVQTRHVFPLQRTILDIVPNLSFDTFHTMVQTYHHSDTAHDFNPLYWLVDRRRVGVWRFVGFGHHVVKGGMFPVIQRA